MISTRSLIPALVALTLAGCVTTPPPHPKATAALGVLSSNAGLQDKARACQELGYFGGPSAVPALASLLDQEHLADYARNGLEGIQDPSAGKALRQALERLNGRYLSGAVNSLGVRREVAAVPDLQKLALDSKRGVAPEALASLGMIGTTEAAKTIQTVLTGGPADLREPAAHAAFTAAAQLAQDGDRAAARKLLESVVSTLPSGHLATVAKNQLAAIR